MEIDKTYTTHGSALHLAAKAGHVDCATMLLEAGANALLEDSYGYTPFQAAAHWGQGECLPVLAAYTKGVVEAKDENGFTALHHAAATNSISCVRVLVNSLGSDINAKDYSGNTPIYLAAQEGSADCVIILLEAGADIFLENNEDYLPFQAAVYWEHKGCIEAFVEHVRKSKKLCGNFTSLHCGVLHRLSDCVKTLLERGSDAHAADSEGNTPFHYTTLINEPTCLDALVVSAIDIQNKNGETALHLSIVLKHSECFKLLLNRGADVALKKQQW